MRTIRTRLGHFLYALIDPKFAPEILRVMLLCFGVVTIWCVIYNRTTAAAWGVPAGYGGDVWLLLAMVKAYAGHEIYPVGSLTVPSLNAPFAANWNDWPFNEKIIPFATGLAANFTGFFEAINLVFLTASLLAALAFYWTCKKLRCHWTFSMMGATLFAFSHFIAARSIAHLGLTYCWHLPPALLVTWWCFDHRPMTLSSARGRVALVVSFITGLLNLYYLFLFCQFLGFGLISQLLRRNYTKVKFIGILLLTAAGVVLLTNTGFFYQRFVYGPNPTAVDRHLSHLEVYGLKLPELYLPPSHRWAALERFGQEHYFVPSLIKGEMGSPYLGIVGCLGLGWLLLYAGKRFLAGKPQLVPIGAWQFIWILLYSLIGGVSLVIGTLGLITFRATNRFSVAILCLSLLFLVRELSRKCHREYRVFAAFALCLLGLWDQLPFRVSLESIEATRRMIAIDRRFVESLEAKLPGRAMAFQLPVMEFPEVLPTLGVGDYEHFRPYFYSTKLHLSYGSNKGRARESWQSEVAKLPPEEMTKVLETYGFRVLLINRKGYADMAASIVKPLVGAGRPILAESELGDLVAIGLQPVSPPAPPEVPPFLASGFYGWEGSWKQGAHTWSMGDAELILTNSGAQPVEKRFLFSFNTLRQRTVTLRAPGGRWQVQVTPGKLASVGPVTLRLPPGETRLLFETDVPAALAGTGDPRPFAFSLVLQPQ